ncbi:S8 family serine peptidase [Fictibacillus aquaticus]|uniref:SLH domain-containing protein n=1 Tax=Fictibacillus aquaticus TaxID=2021314 RepID=A0A235F8V8_9BACL|nr:S8 family serine peptidase [Fictibacillus aquaticus]OYD57750.1 hypothetical protein CGZ90_13910 [Fictibacillus aquaticus]
MFKKTAFALSVIIAGNLFLPSNEGYSSEQKTRVLITFEKKIDQKIAQKFHGKIHHQLPELSIISATVPKAAVKLIDAVPGVVSVKEEIKYKMTETAAGQTVRWPVQKVNGVQTINKGFTGKGVKVAVLDTGISLNHPDLKVSGGVSTVEGRASYADDNGHGTHVAGIISAENNEIGAVGVAPDADVYAVKVLDENGFGYESEIIGGLTWAIENKMDVINMSLSSPLKSDAINAKVNEAVSKGIMVVAAAGNNGTADGIENTIEWPAKNENTIAVGAIDKFTKRGYFSGTGKELDVVAPGVDVYSTYWSEGQNSYMVASGTSMAAPYTAGTLAVYKQKNPTGDLRKMLLQNTIDLGTAGRDNLYGNGLIQTERDTTAPTLPASFSAVHAGKGDVSLKWNATTETVALKGYELYRNGKLIKLIESGTSYHDYLANGKYEYKMRAVDWAGNASAMTNMAAASVSGAGFQDVTNEDWYAPHVIYLSGKSIVSGYADIGYSAGRSVTRAEAIAMIGRAKGLDGTKRKTEFKDVYASSFASGYIQSALNAGIISESTTGYFYPNRTITRGEMAIMLSRAYNLKTTGTVSFSDVTESMAAYKAINLVETSGIASGYADGTFRPNAPVTRGQFGVFTARADNKQFRLQ